MNYVNIMSNLNHNRNSIIVYELATMEHEHDINGLKQKLMTCAPCDDISVALGRDGAEKAELLL